MPVQEGDCVTLPVNLTEHQKKQGISWKFGARGFLIAEITRGNGKVKTYEGQADGRFRDRLMLDQTGSLTITNITANDSGLYEVSNTSTNAKLKTFNVTVYDYLPGSLTSGWSFMDFSIIIPCAAFGFLLVTVLLIFCIRRKRSQSRFKKRSAVDQYGTGDGDDDEKSSRSPYYL
ncbi:hypothetical protein E1301_Tti013467 [Triplophysa tibetana]|uniref:Immunoglobulin V-set domain-containing protein n=1 Tax=Triplophysa tibetana TaxID=1572043 RepID=A0A5A9NPE9_9TELE|nr:hypothetical protein E1301_Tti013467 [Triplophysa tibetana]